MPPEVQESGQDRPRYRIWLRGALAFLGVVVVGRFVLEVAGVPHTVTRYFSSSAVVFLAALYLGAVAPLRGVTKFVQLILPAIVLVAWTQTWVILATLVSGVFRLEQSHFAEPKDYESWANLGGHLIGHVVETGVFSLIALVMMAIVFFLRRWPITVGPAALLGGLVVGRYWVEGMGLPPANAAAWSSTVGVIVSAFYLGGIAPRLGLSTPKQILVPALVIGYAWRVWIFLATLLSAFVPFYKTHFFDPTGGRVVARLARFLVGGVVVEGLIAGLIVWGIATWISRATRPTAAK